MPPKRKKPDGTTLTYTYEGVVRKLNQVCDVDFLVAELQRTALELHQVRMVGWKIAGMHVLRCLKDGDNLGKLDYHFFYHCCSASLKQTEERDHHKMQPSYPDEHKTFLLYWAQCDRVPSHNAPSLKRCAAMITAMTTQMETNTMNMLALHFRRRLHQYIRLRYAKEGKTQLPYKATKRLVDSCYRVKQAPVLDNDGEPTGKAK